MSGRREDDATINEEQENSRDDINGSIDQHQATSSSVVAASIEGKMAVPAQEETKNQENNEEIEKERGHRDGHVNELDVVNRNRLPLRQEQVQDEDVQGDNENFVHRIPEVVSDSERKSNCEQVGAQSITNNLELSHHETRKHSDPTTLALENFPGSRLPVPVPVPVCNNTTAPALPYYPPIDRLPYNHCHDNTGNAPDGGEMYYPCPPSHEAVPGPWMMTPPQPPVVHPFHYQQHQQQQQIDHAVAYANAAAHVAWAAAQAVQQAVLQQQTNTFSPYPPLYLQMGAPAPLIPSPPPSWPPYMSPQPTIPHYYNPNFAPPQYRQSDSLPSISNQRVDTEETPYFDQNNSYQLKKQPVQTHLDNDFAIVRTFPETGEEATMYHQGDTINSNDRENGRLEWYPCKRLQHLSSTESNSNQQQQFIPSRAPTRDKIRRRLRSSDNDSSSSSGGYYHYSKHNLNDGSYNVSCQNKKIHRNGGGRGYGNNSMNKKARSTSNETLIGKTGLVALFEWCNKRRCTPTFTIQKKLLTPPTTELDDEFECIVFLEQPLSSTSINEKLSTSAAADRHADGDDSNCEDGFLHEWGRGYGRNKNAAKQDSARRAMQALIPGVQFDEETGILIALPSTSASVEGTSLRHSSNAANFLDDLAPNLAKRLEISCDDPPDRSNDTVQANDHSSGITIKHKPATQHKRTLGTYPEASTTSEDDDRSTYYASRGASACSVLLHTIIQIDKKRIPDMPTFSYELSPPVSAGNTNPPNVLDAVTNSLDQVNPKNRNKSTTTIKQAVTRCPSGSFKCIAKLKILSAGEGKASVNNEVKEIRAGKLDERVKETIIEAVGFGVTKRDARHVASAKLLSLLFPECNNDMAKVKAAAELMRDQYTASKVQKHHNNISSRSRRHQINEVLEREGDVPTDPANRNCSENTNVSFALFRASDPPLPSCMIDFLADLCSCKPATLEIESIDTNECEICDNATDTFSVKGNSDSDLDISAAVAFRQLGRQKQMDYLVDSALHRFNELDDEGRLICGGGNEDDVGRTVLRRAEPSDLSRIRKLMQNKQNEKPVYVHSSRGSNPRRSSGEAQKGRTKHQVSDLSLTLADVTIDGEMCNQITNRIGMKKPATTSMSHLWSSTSSTILLLCRAIAAHEDPPLGCAFLSFEFSLEKGKVLRVIEIGSESHLPQERFLDCLRSFATCLNFAFEPLRHTHDRLRLTTNDLMFIVESFTKRRRDESDVNGEQCTGIYTVDIGTCGKSFQSLRPVQEESEGSDDDDSKSSGSQMTELPLPANKPPGSVKPSKRSRFQ